MHGKGCMIKHHGKAPITIAHAEEYKLKTA